MNIHSVSLKGLRPQNEDNHIIIINADGKDCNIKNVNLFGVFDGHGGKLVSNYLKENMPKYFLDSRVTYPLSKKYVMNVADHLQQGLRMHNFAYHSGSTCLLVVYYKKEDGSYLNVINSGDSRCVICRDNFAMPLTKDHKPNWPEEHQRITQLGGKIVFDGYDWRIKDLSVSRSFGDVDSTPYVTHTPDFFRYKLDKSDKFIAIFCDGMVENLNNNDIVNFILLNCYDLTTKKRINTNVNIAKKLAEYAIKRGSGDHISAIIVFLD